MRWYPWLLWVTMVVVKVAIAMVLLVMLPTLLGGRSLIGLLIPIAIWRLWQRRRTARTRARTARN
jgi:nicotinamide riboside transporter PnuC